MKRVPTAFQRMRGLLLSGGVALIALNFYILTLAPTITWRNRGIDSGDLAAAVIVLGIPHPPGYPVYVLLGKAWTYFPWEIDVAYRLNILSAVSASLSVGLLVMTVWRVTVSRKNAGLVILAALLSGGTLATSELFWSQAVITEVYAPGMVLLAGLLFLALSIQRRASDWKFILAGIGCSLVYGVWPLIFWLMFPVFIFLSFQKKGFSKRYHRAILVISSFVLLFLIQYFFLWIRAQSYPLINWLGPTTLSNFWDLATAHIYHRYLQPPWQNDWGTIWLHGGLLVGQQIGWLGSFLIIIVIFFVRGRKYTSIDGFFALLSLWLILVSSIFFASYQARDHEVYLLPALYGASLLIGWSFIRLFSSIPSRFQLKLQFSLILLIFVFLFLRIKNTYPEVNLRNDWDAWHFAQQSLQTLPYDAILVTRNDAQTFSLWYAQAKGIREDVVIIDERLLTYDWYRHQIRSRYPQLQPAQAIRLGGLTALPNPIFLLPNQKGPTVPVEVSH